MNHPYMCNTRCGANRNPGLWHTKSCLVRRLLLTRYDGVIPHGHMSRIATDLGLPIAHVSAIVQQLDMVVVCSGSRVFGYKES